MGASAREKKRETIPTGVLSCLSWLGSVGDPIWIASPFWRLSNRACTWIPIWITLLGKMGDWILCLPLEWSWVVGWWVRILSVPPLLPALFCPPSGLPPTHASYQPCPRAPKEVCLSQGGQRSIFLRRRVRSIRIRIILILFRLSEVGALLLHSLIYVCTLLIVLYF